MIDRRMMMAGAGAGLALSAKAAVADGCSMYGHYTGRLETVWEPGVRKFRCVRAVTFTSPCGKRWPVPAGALFNGESIPGFLWLAIGSPLTGLFQDATLFHDYYCAVRTEPAALVHTMFYEALLASGVAAWTAGKFYFGVKLGGPSWDDLQVANARLAAALPQTRGFRLASGAPAAAPETVGARVARSLPRAPTAPPPVLISPPSRSAGAPRSTGMDDVRTYLCEFGGKCGDPDAAQLVVDRNAAAAAQFARYAPGIHAGGVDLARLDAAAATARAAIEQQGWSPADRLAWELGRVTGAPAAVPPQ